MSKNTKYTSDIVGIGTEYARCVITHSKNAEDPKEADVCHVEAPTGLAKFVCAVPGNNTTFKGVSAETDVTVAERPECPFGGLLVCTARVDGLLCTA